ncbi:down syndrome cell adhesion molecule-like protein Dscam2 [Caerostris darwini]|uniref:Down syndrome cell adhesion molecule-like protein Dscam2 n=1 Tax=Caerostris darwini TaxID=1538125 RepID=A0AAV4RF30_9ARAC|nr:down syndrome cell adhesion molecule-like protein Dscam2 [Caerostris darwini]
MLLQSIVKHISAIQVSRDEEPESIDGYYVGYKSHSKTEPYNFKATNSSQVIGQQIVVSGLLPLTDYSVIVQAYNGRGAGPPSEPVIVKTLEFADILRFVFSTSLKTKLLRQTCVVENDGSL